MTWWRLDAEGRVVGACGGDEAAARQSLKPGQTLLPAPAGRDPRRTRRDPTTGQWVALTPPPGPESDPRFLRRTGYPDLSDQVAVLMDLVADLLDGRAPTAAVRRDFNALRARIARVKADHPLPPAG